MTQSAEDGPDYRVILLGASNLTLGLPRLVHSVRERLPGRVEILAAHGHGRSYLKWSHVLYRGLPGIRDCELWKALTTRPSARHTLAIVTDLGCDLFYGEPPSAIVEAVSVCLERLNTVEAQVTFVRPPLAALYEISDWRYYVVKNLFFPGPTIPWSTMREYITRVDQEVLNRASEMGVAQISPPKAWYGFDPIHMTRKLRNQAWEEILAMWDLDESIAVAAPRFSQTWQLWNQKSAERSHWRAMQRHAQPILTWDDGSSLSIY